MEKINRETMESDIFLKEMGQKIRTARNSKWIPINEMSVLTKIDLSNLSFLERGMRNCHIFSLKSIADVLRMDAKEFLSLIMPEKKNPKEASHIFHGIMKASVTRKKYNAEPCALNVACLVTLCPSRKRWVNLIVQFKCPNDH